MNLRRLAKPLAAAILTLGVLATGTAAVSQPVHTSDTGWGYAVADTGWGFHTADTGWGSNVSDTGWGIV